MEEKTHEPHTEEISPNVQSNPKNHLSVAPTGSYFLLLPNDIVEDSKDKTVSSFWKKGEDSLLQLSSIKNLNENAESAAVRLADRLKMEQLLSVQFSDVASRYAPSVAAATGDDTEGCRWLHSYSVWPNLTIYATLSWKSSEAINLDHHWASEAIRSIQRSTV